MDFNNLLKIKKNFDLSGEDNFSLVRLYMPIIGVDSYALFSYLHTLDNNESHVMKSVIEALNFPNIKYLENALSKLEALSLVETYFNESKGYYIYIKKPLNAYTFLSEPLLESFLISQIGQIEVDKIKNIINPTFRGYKNVSKKFDEVYKTSEFELKNYFSLIFKDKFKDKINVKNENFDYILFKMSFDSDFIDDKILEDKELKNLILNISYTYDLNEEEMKDVVLKTITLDKDLNPQDLSKNARRIYQDKNKSKKVRFVTKEPDIFVNSEMDDETFLFINRMESTAPKELLEMLSEIKPSVVELGAIEDLINNTKFPIGVINVLILYVLHEKNYVLPGYNYLEKVANSWARLGIKNTKDALNHINQKPAEQQKQPTKTYGKNKKVVKDPDWYKDYEDQLKNAPKQKDMSDDEIAQVLEEAKDLFK